MGAKREIPTIPCWFSLFFLSPLVEFQGGRGGVCLQRFDFSKIYLFLSVLTLSAFQCAFYCFWSSSSASFKKYSKRKMNSGRCTQMPSRKWLVARVNNSWVRGNISLKIFVLEG